MKTSIVVAYDNNQLIGNQGKLPWNVPEDMKHFKEVTAGGVLIMGRKTFESIGRPLPGRQCWVLSRDPQYRPLGAKRFGSLDAALFAGRQENLREIFVIGGAEVFKEALPLVDRIYLTRIWDSFKGDTYFPDWDRKRFFMVDSKFYPLSTPVTFQWYEANNFGTVA